ncbi:hypothetical protein [Mannheimia varigena]|uniref:DUF7940 domain-containing protein n=1 Tax=Mannheimia varigena TaxID=85404 RepID=UPI0015B41AC7|nr:hypothetical protein [Mannheimia varigena]QLD33172.1 hypothetical protein A6B42_05065 [Mannheimia varigena]
MKFFSLKQLAKSWSVQAWAAATALATIDFSTTWIDGLIPQEHKPLVYAVLGAIGLIARAIQQPSLSK